MEIDLMPNRKYNWPDRYEKEELIRLIGQHLDEGLNFEQVGILFDVTGSAIRYHWDRYFLKKTYDPRSVRKRTNNMKGRALYAVRRRQEGLTLKQIGKLMDVGTTRVGQLIIEGNKIIKKRPLIKNTRDVYKDFVRHCKDLDFPYE